MEVPIIREIVIIFTLSIAVLLICHRIKVPPVVGFLSTGLMCGPHGLRLVSSSGDVETLATIGVVLLLFTVGMEFSFRNMVKFRYFFLVGGFLQFLLTFLICLGVGKELIHSSWAESIFYGFLVSLSSTAIVLRVLDERGETEAQHGRLILGILIFQDITAVLMMLLVPILSGSGEDFSYGQFFDFMKGLLFLFIMSIIAFRAIPKILYYVILTRNRELFLLSLLTTCFAVAWLSSSVGLSLSLGAFLAGLVISESEYSDEAVGNVLPFQAIFTSFFFVSMGMLLDLDFVFKQPLLILVIALCVMAIKTLVVVGIGLLLKASLRTAILSGMALCQIGEFSLVLAYSGFSFQLITDYSYQLFLSVALLTMGLTPLLMSLAPLVVRYVESWPFVNKLMVKVFQQSTDPQQAKPEQHMIIVGFGLRGRHLSRAAQAASIPYFILEMNPETVRVEREKGEPIHFGDPSHKTVLMHAGIKSARTIAVVINNPLATIQIVKAARELNPNVFIVASTSYFTEVSRLFKAGADDVIPDELGASLEVFSRVMSQFDMSEENTTRLVKELRNEGYQILQASQQTPQDLNVVLSMQQQEKLL